ncbi:unnamed protein product [Caenorhabditis auriculariae]|uniref:Uncharacterized protein n=1 Tax=Caenorhabditis auriculariae TaxID=2777116 RepID=A0A8S1GWZ6_9PELO|nr:unnamed protein product [Caenorhabditis auriculariae]
MVFGDLPDSNTDSSFFARTGKPAFAAQLESLSAWSNLDSAIRVEVFVWALSGPVRPGAAVEAFTCGDVFDASSLRNPLLDGGAGTLESMRLGIGAARCHETAPNRKGLRSLLASSSRGIHLATGFRSGFENRGVAWGSGARELPSTLSYFIFKTVHEFSPLTCSIVTTTRKLFTIIISVVFMNHPLSTRQSYATAVVFLALTVDAVDGKLSQSKKKQSIA